MKFKPGDVVVYKHAWGNFCSYYLVLSVTDSKKSYRIRHLLEKHRTIIERVTDLDRLCRPATLWEIRKRKDIIQRTLDRSNRKR